jgi:FAD/FMN-containing dehydrogenase/Fe-S oxidoreductase
VTPAKPASYPKSIDDLDHLIQGDAYFDTLTRHMLATDGSIFQKLPAGVVYPKSSKDVAITIEFAHHLGLTVHARGAGSGLCGASLGDGIIIDFTKYMNRLIQLDEKKRCFTCEPGFRFGELEETLKGKGLFFPPDPSSGEYATFGGMFGTNASGAHSVKYGNVADYILDADIVLATGEMITLSKIASSSLDTLPENLKVLSNLYGDNKKAIDTGYPPIPCNVAGYNLRGLVQDGRLNLGKLFAGAEGTLGITTRLTFRLQEKPTYDTLVVAYFDDILNAATAVQKILPMAPSGIEIMDKSLLNLAKVSNPALKDSIPNDVDNALLIEFDGFEPDRCADQAKVAMSIISDTKLSARVHVAISSEEKENFWAVRKAAVPILYKLKSRKKILALIEDAAVPTERLVDFFKGLYKMMAHHNVDFVIYGHIAKGLLHTRPLLDLKNEKDVDLLRTLADDAFDLVHSLGGSVSGEHGDGRLRSAYVSRQYSLLYDLFLKTKHLLDPNGILNPEIITHNDPDQMKKSLRYGSGYYSTNINKNLLHWPEGFTDEVEKCHGCSKCTTVTTATRMCPIYKYTRNESAAPKAKANILRGLISGAIGNQQLYERSFQQVIDQCANCGSCHKECPSNVNIPKMAMEARALYVQKFGPTRHARLVSNVEIAGRYTRKVSRALTPIMSASLIRRANELFTGISAQRDVLEFPSRSLFERIGKREGEGDKTVLYFAGCFASYMKPQIGEAVVKVLNHMDMVALTPFQHCCGLPSISKGMVAAARNKVQQNLKKWQGLVNQVDHIVVSCSSCGYALMNDWAYLEEGTHVSMIADKVIHISRLINQYKSRLNSKPTYQKVAYHQPCHLKIQPDPNSSVRMLSMLPNLSVDHLNSHCCGMIGSWGMADENFSLSKKIGSDMLSKLDQSDADIGVTDCPTCRLQMEQFSDKKILHPVEIVAAGL